MQKQVAAHLPAGAAETATFTILMALSVSHMLNDTMQSLLPALYPMLKSGLGLSYGEVGLITLAFQLTASLLQPVVGPGGLAIVLDRELSELFPGEADGLGWQERDIVLNVSIVRAGREIICKLLRWGQTPSACDLWSP